MGLVRELSRIGAALEGRRNVYEATLAVEYQPR